ncbi:unnamed protein product [Cuscuta epithymum]|uniref:Uncharacterized protein n=1 Tax=Cuscuta epithymum TaxID=186058 RepID=A0AAV0DPU1_9ASTE|nr:unnamed protein product [Cuscuta epithymum]CAH9142372.1 unnamed protein product [Cuscuta epithymum]
MDLNWVRFGPPHTISFCCLSLALYLLKRFWSSHYGSTEIIVFKFLTIFCNFVGLRKLMQRETDINRALEHSSHRGAQTACVDHQRFPSPNKHYKQLKKQAYSEKL